MAFDAVAEDYDRHRPGYPSALIDLACQTAHLHPGERVLEVGCGTGQLTADLLQRGLQVTAVEPGGRLIAQARARLRGSGCLPWDAAKGSRCGQVRFVNARLEDATLARSHYQAVFSASAIHWVDPDLGWRIIAEALVEDGTLALLSYFGLREPWSDGDQRALRAALAGVAPELASTWPGYLDMDSILAGAARRQGNISEVWAWLCGRPIAREQAARLFDAAALSALPRRFEHTPEEIDALLGTMSFCSRLSPAQREALAAANRALHQQLGRLIRSSTVACLVTARRHRWAGT
jgi:SAM-dependent methyltransferase